jgi:hypothetical protein
MPSDAGIREAERGATETDRVHASLDYQTPRQRLTIV